MHKRLMVLMVALTLTACSVELAEVTRAPANTSAPTGEPQATVAADAAPAATAPPWADLNLTGSLLFTLTQQGVWRMQLSDGTLTNLYQPADPVNSWVTAATASPDGSTIVMAFAPPPGQDEIQFGYTDLYGLNIADSTAQPWLIREDKRESLFSPTWSPDGRFVYFARLDRRPILGSNPEQFDIGYNVERAAYPDGQPEVVVADAFFPRLSADGQRLVYVAVDPQTFANALYVSDTNGGNAVRLFGPEQFIAVDSPLFTPDGQYVLFSAVSDGTASAPAVQSLFDWLTGVQAAEAHNVPSDWWRIPVTGGQAEKITNLLEIGLYGAFSPDGRYMAFITSNGLMLMNPDGSGVRKLAPLTNAFGTLEWMR